MTETTEAIDAIADRINAGPAHAARVTAALGELADATATLAATAGAGDADAGLVAFARATVELRARLVAEHGEDDGGRAWGDGMALLRWRAEHRATGAGTA